MSYQDVTDGLHAVFATIPAIRVILDHEPTSAQDAPLIYSLLDNIERRVEGTTTHVTYTTLHRLCLVWQDPAATEDQLRTLADSIAEAVEADPKLGGRLRPGDAQIVRGDAGWMVIGGTALRVLDMYSQVLEISRYRGL